MLAGVAVSAIALAVASSGSLSPLRLGAGSLFVGSGICAMHYVGMAALRSPQLDRYSALTNVTSGRRGLALIESASRAVAARAGYLSVQRCHFPSLSDVHRPESRRLSPS
jgi:NO-binding membrane sensor protein with MHYT domain